MDIKELRNEIDSIDDKILELFERRMDICRDIARYKNENKLPVLNSNREAEIINNVRLGSPSYLADSSAILFSNMMDISKVLQSEELARGKTFKAPRVFAPENAQVVACQGMSGAYSEKACIKLFGEDKSIRFAATFPDVLDLVENDRADFGLLALENSNVGTIEETYSLLASSHMYINCVVRVEIQHCFAVKEGTDPSKVTKVYSKKEALAQCAGFIKKMGLSVAEYSNTAVAARMVADSTDDTIGCICSGDCARKMGLKIVEERAADAYPNFTRFVCFSKNFSSPPDADTISIAFNAPHTPGGLYRTLTKFAVNGLNLTKIVSMPIAGQDFDVRFFLDFKGSYTNRKVAALLDDLEGTMSYFRFLGNFREI